jgi:hypothetical protein
MDCCLANIQKVSSPSEVIHMRLIRFPFAFSSTECPAAVHLFESEAEDMVTGLPKIKNYTSKMYPCKAGDVVH